MNDSTSRALQDLLKRIDERSARVGVIGLGYVGLPLAVVFAEAGLQVVGVDVNEAVARGVNLGESHVEDIPSSRLQPLVENGLLSATTDFSALSDCDGISICVPTPLRKTGDPDVSYIIAATEQVKAHIRPGTVVVLESTTYPGTTREVILPELEEEGLTVGKDLFLCFSPERVDPGREDWTTVNTPKVMGGVTDACVEAGMALYGAAIETLVPVTSPESAEMVKLLENTFRAVNIGLANELLIMCDRLGLDVWEIIDAASTKPFGFMRFTPGPGLGGHCIPIDPLYLSWKLRSLNYTARFIELASEVNTSMPAYWVQHIQDALNEEGKAIKGSRVLVVGVAYKRDISDMRESPALDIIQLLQDKGADVSYHDPHVPVLDHAGIHLRSSGVEEGMGAADCVVVVTDHTDVDWDAVGTFKGALVDTRAVLNRQKATALAT
ncbi:nucleotide sugar dehydrogenase [Rubricoccus marinus]|uniref:UDP-N-acetyl-D-glucosamine dehydrogenase n=1 Tax=Rubricoccus marinus TaxID=716817 RepID=A0A259U0R6_9BACT|nr:nucleotide sugar dehydrogenase [Rubricoccus marinus]OZC03437.1 UDP-N-acetyl-D-glucosamine dehydrogenase [Rubricoccus marinus]